VSAMAIGVIGLAVFARQSGANTPRRI